MKGFKRDLLKWKEYDYVVINDDLNKCYNNIIKIIKSKNKSRALFNRKLVSKHVKNLLS